MSDTAAVPSAPVFAITLFTDDLAASRSFYTSVFGIQGQWEDDESSVFAFPNVLINVLVSSAAPELIDPKPVAPAAAGSRIQLTVNVDDVDATIAKLAELGVPLINGPIDRPWGPRTATFEDPGGHVWEIAGPGPDAEGAEGGS